MADARKKKKGPAKKAVPHSALNVVPGKKGGHDGMPGGKPLTRGNKDAEGVSLETNDYVQGVLRGDRTVLGRTITLIESNAPAHQDQAQEVLQALIPHAGRSIRIGITGVPGGGKSTLIDQWGERLIKKGRQVAVMAVDPSSVRSKGSILGDKTRMENLSRNPKAFIRPSPAGGALGGVARKTRETMVVFEAAGYDVLLVETVGVGQNEIAVRSMVDFFLLLLAPGAGDELQGIKRGVMELADAVVINKADGDRKESASRSCGEYARALHYLQPATKGWETRAFTVSALQGTGIDDLWKTVERFQAITAKNHAFKDRRRGQAKAWLHQLIEEQVKTRFYRHPAIVAALPGMEAGVLDGSLPTVRAAGELLKIYEESTTNSKSDGAGGPGSQESSKG
ncbi:MAG: methylmalonyl Co-A mutase-associated GTPase MeaB [Planctomycetes bacterium]|nr:methylmalonyl Co-A mutase-associated GTPase MeaB [Planctomycetota bacterium]